MFNRLESIENIIDQRLNRYLRRVKSHYLERLKENYSFRRIDIIFTYK